MIASDATVQTADLGNSRPKTQRATSILSRRIWLPAAFYNVLPGFYIFSGISALFATLYISDWFWVLPHTLLFSTACLHMGVIISRRRNRDH